jgi:hypothetical protein
MGQAGRICAYGYVLLTRGRRPAPYASLMEAGLRPKAFQAGGEALHDRLGGAVGMEGMPPAS